MNINVPPQAVDHFWEEPPPGNWEFWGFRFKPQCQIGDLITFHIDKKPVATAIVAKVEKPGQTSCNQTGRFKNCWKVYWKPETFRELERR